MGVKRIGQGLASFNINRKTVTAASAALQQNKIGLCWSVSIFAHRSTSNTVI